MSKKSKYGDRVVVINEPKRPSPYAVYRMTIISSVDHQTYVGFTGEGLRKRAHRHTTDPNRKVYDAFHAEPNTLMIVEHMDSAKTENHARVLEKRHIKREHKRVGNKLLNTQHTKKK